jgi:long-subunit acyl-CoA synthetase (AMP-forming)
MPPASRARRPIAARAATACCGSFCPNCGDADICARLSEAPTSRRTPPAETDVALISFTSGTSGAPKAIPRSHGFLSAQHRAVAPLLHSPEPERDLVAFPVFVLINIAEGRTSVLPNWRMSRLADLAPATLRNLIADQRITRALLPPSLCEKLAALPAPGTLHTVFTGGGPVFPDTVARLRASGSGPKMTCVYGSTEAEPIAHLDTGEIDPGGPRSDAGRQGIARRSSGRGHQAPDRR